MSIVVTPSSPAGHQRLTSSGVVKARYTWCGGASKVRVIRICLSVGSATVVVRLPVSAVMLFSTLLFQLVQHGIQRFEAVRPGAFVALHPVMDGLERVTIESVHALPSLVTHLHGANLSKNPQVLGYLGLCHAKQLHQIVDWPLRVGEESDDLAPPRFRNRVEGIRGGCCACH